VHKEKTNRIQTLIDIENVLQIDIELFKWDDFVCDIAQHRLVPKHTKIVIAEEEKEKKDLDKWPRIMQTDAVCRYYRFRIGDVLRIDRNDGTVSYRVVDD
jgi:DNA-directed RNA polymerase subunit H (RpoH/RPB5)